MNDLLKKLRTFDKSQIVVLLLFGVLLLIIAMPAEEGEQEEKAAAEPVQEVVLTESQCLEAKLEEILSHVSGIGKTEVMISLKSDGKKLVEKDIEYSQGKEESSQENQNVITDQTTNRESTVYEKDAQGNEIPYVTEELAPEISGVLVIAQGAGNSVIVNEITEAVMALFGVEAHKIKVMKME